MPYNPMIDPPPASVDLADAPLYKVIIELKFSEILQIGTTERVAAFQDRVRLDYPIVNQRVGLEVLVTSNGVTPSQAPNTAKVVQLWNFSDLSQNWLVVLSPSSLALVTRSYGSRSDFTDRFRRLLQALMDSFGLPIIGTRLGVRYIDRVVSREGLDFSGLLNREAMGMKSAPFSDLVQLAIGEAMVSAPLESADLRLRWGFLPANTTYDPMTVEGSPNPSWVLDQDMFKEGVFEVFTPDAVLDDIRKFSTRMYGVFRWVITDEFLRTFGGVI